ncbi:MFS transporter [Amycolatopsis magusensis]|uniref:MFS transporter n=1 Tax=Amycolatopsis magusensis TaxID=882444 RepID=UPI003C2D3C12
MSRSRVVLPLYACAEAFSFVGNSAIQLALPWLVLLRTGDPAAAAGVAAATGVAQILATAAVGPLIDRFGARRMAVFADVCSAASVAALALLDTFGGLSFLALVLLAAAGGLFDIPGMTARQTLMPRVAERSGLSLDTVAGLRQGIFGVSFLAGPAGAGVLLAALAPGTVLWLTAACSGLAALATLAVRVPAVGSDGAEPGVRGAWRTVRRHPVIVKLLVVATMGSLVSTPLLSVLLPAHFAALGRPDFLGFTMSSFAVGVIAGSALYTLLARSSRRLAWVASIAESTAGLVLIATLDGFWVVAAGAVVVGLGSGVVGPLFGVVISERVPGTQLGRVMCFSNALSLAAGPIGLGATGLVVGAGSLAALAWGIAGAWVLMAAFALSGRGLRDLESPSTGTEDEDGVREAKEHEIADDQPTR